MLQKNSYPALEDVEISRRLADGLHPLTVAEIGGISVLKKESNQQIWNFDLIRQAVQRFPKGEIGGSTIQNAVANAQQNLTSPRTFLRRLDQLRPDLLPVQDIYDCSAEISVNSFNTLGVPREQHAEVNAACHKIRFGQVSDWLLRLPIEATAPVYVARQPEETLVSTWSTFVHHWDTFFDPFDCLNVVNNDPRWFLFFHPEELAIWGCTADYAYETKVDAWPTYRTTNDVLSAVESLILRRKEEARKFVHAYIESLRL